MNNTDHNLIQLTDISFRYHGEAPVLEHTDFALQAGQRIGLQGDIGSGKTTLLHLLVGLLRPDRGTIEAFGRVRREEHDFWEVRERMGLLFQDPDDQLFCPTVREDIAFGPLNQGKPRAEVGDIVSRALARVGMEGYEERVTHHLSGGEKRLISLAAVLAMEPDVLLLDEPENGLDPSSYERIQSLLLALPQAMIVVSHNTGFLNTVTTQSVRIEAGRIVSLKTA